MKVIKQVVYVIAALAAFGLVRWGLSALQTNNASNNTANYFTNETWQPFNSTEGGFSINFPKYPTTNPSETQNSNGVTYVSTQYSAEDSDGDSYVAIYGYYPNLLSNKYNAKSGIKGSINGMVGSDKSNQLISSNFVDVGTHQGADYVIYNKNMASYLRGKVVVVLEGSNPVKIYILMVASKNSNATDNFTKFINSFGLL